MSKKQKNINLKKLGKDDISDIIYKYYNGNVDEITKSNLKELYNKGNVNETQFKFLKKLLKKIEEFPNLDIILNDPPIVEEKSKSPSTSELSTVKEDDKMKYISFQRKAFIDWLNTDFYENIIKNKGDSELNIWQIFV